MLFNLIIFEKWPKTKDNNRSESLTSWKLQFKFLVLRQKNIVIIIYADFGW